MATASASRQSLPTLSASTVKAAAQGHWQHIYQSLGGLPADLLDGRHHPCPKCGGVDRFRAVDIDAGGIYCNQCFKGDAIDALCWLRGWSFREALEHLAEFLGLDSSSAARTSSAGNGRTNGHSTGTTNRSRSRRGGKKKHQSDWDQLALLSPSLTGLFARDLSAAKPPISLAAIEAAGGRPAQWPVKASAESRLDAIAFPVRLPGNLAGRPDGALLVRRDGRPFPEIPAREGKGAGLPERKVHLLKGTPAGLVFARSLHEPAGTRAADAFAAAEVVWKVEGITDLLAIVPLLPAGVAAFTASNGAEAFPPELAEAAAGKHLIIIHDADTPGQEGMATAAARCISAAASVRLARLPYEITANHGRDLRDWLLDAPADQPRTYDDLLALAGEPETYESLGIEPASATEPPAEIEEAPDDPHRLARICAAQWDRVAFYKDEWYVGAVETGWRVMPESEIKAHIVAGIKTEFDEINRIERARAIEAGRTPPTCRKVTGACVTNTTNALRSLSLISGAMPFNTFLGGDDRPQFASIEPGPKDWIAMGNGLLCLDRLFGGADLDEVLLPHSLAWWSTIRLPYPFDPDAKCPKWLAFLDTSLEGDAQRIALLQEWAGYLLTPDTNQQKFLVLAGEGGNGKSVFQAGIEAMLGPDQISNVQLEIFGQRFALTNTLGKLVNMCGDVGEIDRLCEGHLKSYVTGETMFFDRKGLPGINTRPTARLMVNVNNLPRISDRSDGVFRRMLLCPFEVQIQASKIIRGMDKREYWESHGEVSGILNWAISGLARLREQGTFTMPDKCRAALENYRTESNPAREFLTERYEAHPDGREACEEVYKAYREWCNQNGYKPLASRTFGREVFRTFKGASRVRSRIDGGRSYTYEGITEKILDDF